MPNIKDIKFKTGEIELEGTLTLPEKIKSPPVVLLLPGSGPVDRNENVKAGLKKFICNNLKTIAEHLASQGIASFRYDKRGVGTTKALEKEVGFNDILNDARNAVDFLTKNKEINSKKIYLLGHSEGGIVATIIASESKNIAGFIGIASPINPFDETVLKQVGFILEKRLKSKEKSEKFTNAFKQVFKLMRKERNWDKIDAKQIKNIFSKVSFAFKILPANTTKKTIAKQFRPKWFIQSFDYDFEEITSKIKCPVLLIFGKKDYQVPLEEGRKIEETLNKSGNKDVELKEIEDLNHLLRYNPGPMDPKTSVKSISDNFDQRILNQIGEWFKTK